VLSYWLEWGKYLDTLPKESSIVQKQPTLMTGLDFYFNAYQELLTERGEMGVIPWSSIIRWAEYNNCDHVDRLMKYIRAMESVQRQKENERRSNSNRGK
jgi:hypothetical protein